jgi:regulation of enolase protein 1 (concanavalin A-like superfamily)
MGTSSKPVHLPKENFMKIKLSKLGIALALIVVGTGCTVAPTPPPTSLPAKPTSAPALATWTDDFNGVLAPGWSWVDEDPSHWNLQEAPGVLRIVTQGESLYNAGRPKNLLLRDAPVRDFEITTKVTFNPQSNFQQAAILIYQDHDDFVLLNRGFCDGENCPGSGVFLDSEMNGETNFNTPHPGAAASLQTMWLRLQKAGTTYTGFYSGDGQRWTELGHVENPLQPTKVGLTANNSDPDPTVPQITADYDSFTIEAASLSPTVIINGDQCSYDGPEKVPAKGTFTLKLENPKPTTGLGFGIVTLAEGKTLEDLKTLTTVLDLPKWITVLSRFGRTEAGMWTHDFDWTANSAYQGEPIYIVCVNRPTVLAVFGPIEVTP